MLTSEMVKEAALSAGADLVGIGDMARFEGVPAEMDPRAIFPEARTVIGMAFRIPRGVQQGIEQGTQFYQYPSMAYGGINEIFAPAVLYHVGKMIEDHGYEAAVYVWRISAAAPDDLWCGAGGRAFLCDGDQPGLCLCQGGDGIFDGSVQGDRRFRGRL